MSTTPGNLYREAAETLTGKVGHTDTFALAVGAAHVRERNLVEGDLARERVEALTGVEGNAGRMSRVEGSGNHDIADLQKARAKQAFNDQIYLAMLNQNIAALEQEVAGIEDQLRDKYGDDFAEKIAAKYLDEDTAKRLPGESDEDYRKRITRSLDEKIKAGEIDPDDPLIKQWVEQRTRLSEEQDKRREYIAGNVSEMAENGTLKDEKAIDLAHTENSDSLKSNFEKQTVQQAGVESGKDVKVATQDPFAVAVPDAPKTI